MARLPKVPQNIFAINSLSQEVEQFGSFANGGANYTTDPATIQALPAFLRGWFGAIQLNDSPCVEDMNSLFLLLSYQLAYLQQVGTSEWDVTSTYYIGDLVQDGTGVQFLSITDNNTGNALSDLSNWFPVNYPLTTSTGNSGSFSTTSTTPITITNMAQTTFVYNRVVRVSLSNVTNGTQSFVEMYSTASSPFTCYFQLLRDSTVIGIYPIISANPSGAGISYPPSSFVFYDNPTTGTYTYYLQCWSDATLTSVINVSNCIMLLEQLP